MKVRFESKFFDLHYMITRDSSGMQYKSMEVPDRIFSNNESHWRTEKLLNTEYLYFKNDTYVYRNFFNGRAGHWHHVIPDKKEDMLFMYFRAGKM